LNNVAWVYATCPVGELRNGTKAVELATRACELTKWSDTWYFDTLAGAYAETAEFQKAIEWQRKAMACLNEPTRAGYRNQFEERLKLYESGKPYHQPTSRVPAENLRIPEESQACVVNLQKIYQAIKQYEKEKGTLPNWLSDLVPDYLDKELLLCPSHPDRVKAAYYPDPYLPCSYDYEFSPTLMSNGLTCWDWKIQQWVQYGDVVPVVRCFNHGNDTVLNLSVGGQIYWSALVWESLF
jgi:tetratricopeptide (TPR) repeat protein